MLPLTEEIEKIENMPVHDITPTISARLERLKDIQMRQSSKGGPATKHHDIRTSVSRSKPSC